MGWAEESESHMKGYTKPKQEKCILNICLINHFYK